MKNTRSLAVPLLALSMVLTGLISLAAPNASAATPFKDISSDGPLTHIYIGNDLSCQIAHSGDTGGEVFPPSVIPGDCGTFLATSGKLFAPDFVNHGSTATGSLGSYVPFTPVSQSEVTGSGSAEEPLKVVTVVDAGNTGLRLTETDTYVVGEESYRTDVQISNSADGSQSAILYRAADCFLAGSDQGVGIVDTTSGAVGCQQDPNAGDRIEQWVPITGGNRYREAHFSDIWAQIGQLQPFDDTCVGCQPDNVLTDNGAGLSWNISVPGGGTATYSQITTFSPSGKQALSAAKTADAATATPGSTDGYTITIHNPNDGSVTVHSIVDDLPAGFSYVPGSTTGATTQDPSIQGHTLTWAGPFAVSGGGDVSLHFSVTVPNQTGDYFNNATATADQYSVAPSGPTAEITVGGGGKGSDLGLTMKDLPDPVTVGLDVSYRMTVKDRGPGGASSVTLTDTLPAGTTYVSSSPSQGTCSIEQRTMTCVLGALGRGDTATVQLVVQSPEKPGSITNQATVSGAEADPNPADNTAQETTAVRSNSGDTASAFVPPTGGTVSTGSNPTPKDPQVTTVIVPPGVSGVVTIREGKKSKTADCPSGDCFGQVVRITSPSATPRDPLVFIFTWDGTIAPLGEMPWQVRMYHNGDLVPKCRPHNDGHAKPDPCINKGDFVNHIDYRLTVFSSTNGSWRGR